ncbi:trihelix transcription factor ASR3-like [Vitis riparia]|uniref:trihelix transcription factor ASR3-like n=1 Tax=Vitis riparia TaxID=96939 RepID=UPI00155B17F9|nr:trihelix transcription factor ASR3-like [Vitis riparia]
MSEPPPTAATTPLNPHHVVSTAATSSLQSREYRKGNWTIQETLILITAKKLDDERRIKVSSTPPDPSSSAAKHHCRTGELRWKWVENYCWSHGCLRSQNQCNDKWDNLLRDYKKVREYESRSSAAAASGDEHHPSYWKMEKHERKDRNLPSNMSSEVFEALNEVVHRRYPLRTIAQPSSSSVPSPAPISVRPPSPPPPPTTAPAASETSDSSETECSEKLESNTKRRKVRNIGSSIVRSASVLARTMKSCDEKKERRHREVMELEERRMQIEETRNEDNRKGINGLVSAVNNLSGAIQTLISGRQSQT